MEITKREILASISIIAIMLIIGLSLSGKIQERKMDYNEKYNKALKIKNAELFKYGMNTNVGNAFVYGELEALDSVSFPEINKKYLYIKRVKERYTMHTRTVTKTVNGKTHTKTETYWTWDKIRSEDRQANKVKFCSIEFKSNKFNIPKHDYIDTIKITYNTRYKFYGYPVKSKGTLFANLSNTDINKPEFYTNMTIEETIDYLESDIDTIIFWIVWIALSGSLIYRFYYLDNKWLNK